ncbi:hypothetical protein Clacol_010116 [Clathrus columnatus]|uniref:Uncharacterized protein n=1 Tax=Clathrus columnatus TaxID=1419009 RepID=A0AAV5AT75_9AGAM|nr:hypothetical protein Clacol_010116 [Clathrus columnatus]
MFDDNHSSQLLTSNDNVDVDLIFGTSSIGSLIKLEGEDNTSLLVREARKTAEDHINEFLENYPTTSLGRLLITLLDNASDEDSLQINCSPLRYTAGVICGAHNDNQLESVATVWLELMLLPSKLIIYFVLIHLILKWLGRPLPHTQLMIKRRVLITQ